MNLTDFLHTQIPPSMKHQLKSSTSTNTYSNKRLAWNMATGDVFV